MGLNLKSYILVTRTFENIKLSVYLLCPEAVAEQVDLAALDLLLAAAVAVQTVHEAGPPAAAQTPCVHRQ